MKTAVYLFISLFLAVVSNVQGQVKIKEINGMAQKKFKDAPKKMFIAEFRVNYQLLFSQTEVAEGGRELGGGQRGKATAGLTMGVKGLSEEDLHKITDEIYEDYVKGFKKLGYELVSADDAAKAEIFEGYEMKTGGTLNEAQKPGLISATPTGYQYLIKRVTDKGKEKGNVNGYKVSSQLGGALVTRFNIDVLFVEDAESGASKALSSAAGGVAKIVVRPNLRIAAGQSYHEIYFAEKEIKPLAYTKQEVKEDIQVPGVFEDKKYKAAETAQTDMWGTDIGTMKVFNVTDAYLSKTIPLNCDPNKYSNGVQLAAKSYVNAILDMYKDY